MLSADDYQEIYQDIERVIVAVSTDSYIKQIKHRYFLTGKDLDNVDKIYYILSAEIRHGIEKAFDKYIDRDTAKHVKEMAEARKRPRKPKEEVVVSKDSKQVSEGTVGRFTVKSYE